MYCPLFILTFILRQDAILGIDFGSTTTRASLWMLHEKQFSNVGDYDDVPRIWQKDLFSPKEFPSIGVLGNNLVGVQAFGKEESVNLKYALYAVAGIELPDMLKYPPMEAQFRQSSEQGACDLLRESIVSFFRVIREYVDDRCESEELHYSRIGLTIPTQWELYKDLQNTYESIIRTVWYEIEFKITFIWEVEAIAHIMALKARPLLRQHQFFTVFDFGGHTIVRRPRYISVVFL